VIAILDMVAGISIIANLTHWFWAGEQVGRLLALPDGLLARVFLAVMLCVAITCACAGIATGCHGGTRIAVASLIIVTHIMAILQRNHP
jgi:fumarate reductase subunit D